MPDVLRFLVGLTIDLVRGRAALVAENALLRQQLIVAQRKLVGRVRWAPWQRCTMALAAHFAPAWRSVVLLVQPATILRWHHAGFRLFWTWKSRRPAGRPSKDPEIRALVRRMANANPTWGAPRIHGELQKLGLDISERTVARLMPHRRGPPSPTWRAFLDNQVKTLVAVDFFVVPTATFACSSSSSSWRSTDGAFSTSMSPSARAPRGRRSRSCRPSRRIRRSSASCGCPSAGRHPDVAPAA